MSPVLVQSRPIPVRRAQRVAGVAVAALFALSLFGLLDLVRDPAVVDRVTIANESRDELTVSISSGEGSLLPISVVEAGRSASVTDVLDQGDRWVFVFTRAGERVGVVTLDRSQLEADGWRVVVPENLGASTGS